MKNKMFKGIALALFAVTVFACNKKEEKMAEPAPATATAPMVDAAKIKTDIQAMETDFADKMNTGKSEEVGYYADDAQSYGQNKPVSMGKDAIHKSMKEEADMMPKGGKVAYETHEVFPAADGNQVVELGSYKVSDAANAVVASGNYMALFEMKDGKYVCVRDMSASEMPAKK